MKTLLFVDDVAKGMVEDDVKVGDILTLNPKEKPFVVGDVQPLIGYANLDCSHVAYAYTQVNKNNKKVATKMEKALAKKLGGRPTPASGALSSHKGDVQSRDFLGEQKFTAATTYRLSLRTWNKISTEAFNKRLLPLLEITLDQEKDPFSIILMDSIDFGTKYDTSEEELVKRYYSLLLKSSGITIILDKKTLMNHHNAVICNLDKTPSYLIQLKNKLLIGFKTSDFKP